MSQGQSQVENEVQRGGPGPGFALERKSLRQKENNGRKRCPDPIVNQAGPQVREKTGRYAYGGAVDRVASRQKHGQQRPSGKDDREFEKGTLHGLIRPQVQAAEAARNSHRRTSNLLLRTPVNSPKCEKSMLDSLSIGKVSDDIAEVVERLHRDLGSFKRSWNIKYPRLPIREQ